MQMSFVSFCFKTYNQISKVKGRICTNSQVAKRTFTCEKSIYYIIALLHFII